MCLYVRIKERMSENKIIPGRYRHYKGGEYQVIDTATHSETEETVVVYRPLYGEQALWVRPLEIFCENVEVSGKQVPRFTLIDDA